MLNNNTPYEPERVGGTEIWIAKDLIQLFINLKDLKEEAEGG